MTMDTKDLAERVTKALSEAANFTHRWRAMRVTLECGHLRLTPWMNTTMGIGAYTGCMICPSLDGRTASRQVVNIEETGVLHEGWFACLEEESKNAEGAPRP